MNTTTMSSHHENMLGSKVLGGLLADSPIKVILLGFAVFVSCIAVVYMKDINRRLSVQSQMISTQTNALKTEADRMLLEQSAWSMQARIERIATNNLDMQLPNSNAVVMVRE